MVRTKAPAYKSNRMAVPIVPVQAEPAPTEQVPMVPAPTEQEPGIIAIAELAPTEPAEAGPAPTEPAVAGPAPFSSDFIDEVLEITGFEVSMILGNEKVPDVKCMYSKKDGDLSIVIDGNLHISIPAKEYFNKILEE